MLGWAPTDEALCVGVLLAIFQTTNEIKNVHSHVSAAGWTQSMCQRGRPVSK